jgi:ATP-dependent DNA helicase RecQ
VPAYLIFHDTTLAELARVRPRNLAGLRGITGFGERKLAQWGEAICALIAAHAKS